MQNDSYDASGVMECLSARVPNAIKPILAEKRAVCVRLFLKSGLWKDRQDLVQTGTVALRGGTIVSDPFCFDIPALNASGLRNQASAARAGPGIWRPRPPGASRNWEGQLS